MGNELEKIVHGLSKQQKLVLRELLDLDLKSDGNAKTLEPRKFAWARGRIQMAADFDAPLEDFREYCG